MELTVSSFQQFDRGEPPNVMSVEISPADGLDGERSAAHDRSPAALRTLAVEVSSAGLRVVDRGFESVRGRLDGATGLPSHQAPGRDTVAQPRGLVLRPALLGFAAMLAIAIGASLPS